MLIKSFVSVGLLTILLLVGVSYADDFSPEKVETFFKKWSPTLCVLKFTQTALDPRTGEEQQQPGSALAVLVSADGLLMTNGYIQRENISSSNFRAVVVQDEKEIEYQATLLEKPRDVNLSFLRIKSDSPVNLPYLHFLENAAMKLGEEVAILGVMSENMDFHPSLSLARIAAVLEQPRTTYCIDIPLKLGAVTGPVMNKQGEVIGVTGFELSANEGGDLYTRSGHPMIFQSGLFMHYINNPPGERLEDDSGTEEAWLGVFTQPLKEEYAEYWGIDKPGGLIVSTLVPDSPAEAAGLQVGDIIRVFDGQPIVAVLDRDVLSFTKMVRAKEAGARLPVEILRDKEPLTIEVILGRRPRSTQEADEYTDETLGIVVRELTQDLRTLFNLGEDVQGVIVRRVISGSAAQIARMQPGIIIMSLGNTAVSSLEDYKEAIAAIEHEKPLDISVFARAGTATGFFRLKPRW